MQYVRMGRTALRVSRLSMGTLNLRVNLPPEDSFDLLDQALGAGINLVDTANQYGWQIHRGMTEEFLGEWFGKGGGRREKVILGTKVFTPMTDWPNDGGLSARHIIAACEDSLRRLNTEWIDLYQMHHVDRDAPWEEVWQAMEILVQQGKVRYVGSSNFAGWHLVSAQEAAARRNFLGLVSEQCCYNLVRRHVEMELIPAAVAYGLGVLVWSPLHGGLLGGALRKLEAGTAVKTARGRAMVALEYQRDQIAQYEKFCTEIGRSPAQVALAWVLSRPGVTSVIVGPRKHEHLNDAIATLEEVLPDDVQEELDRLFPPIGNGGPAPEAWAW